jgi:phage terminase large subunit-like protein
MPLDEWQDQALEAAMGERVDGRWASKYVGISAPRQNGKSQLIVARALAGVLLFGEKSIIISAHETDTAREVWKRLIDVVEDNPALESRVTGRMDAINREFLAFGRGKDRQVIKLKARRQSGTRGFSCDCLLLDEAQILGKRQWGSINPTMSARPNPQMWLFGTPPTDGDDPFAFARVRQNALASRARHCWLEWAADPDDDFDDPEVWAKANPSYGVRISEEACADDRAAMDDEQFAMERLGIWADHSAAPGALPHDRWLKTLADPDAPRGDSVIFGVDVTGDRVAWVAAAWTRPDGDVQVMLTNNGEPIPAHRIVDECVRLEGEWGGAFVPPRAFEEDLGLAGVTVHKLPWADFAGACGDLEDRIKAGTIHHGNQPALNAAVKAATWRTFGSGSEHSLVLRDRPEVGPLAAVVRALSRINLAVEPAAPLSTAQASSSYADTSDLTSLSF